MRLKNSLLKIEESLNLIAEWMQRFFDHILHSMTPFYLKVQMKSLKDFKCCWVIPNVDIKKGKIFQFFGGITSRQVLPCIKLWEWSSEAIYFSAHQFELIYHKIFFGTNRIDSLLTKSVRIFFRRIFFLLWWDIIVFALQKI